MNAVTDFSDPENWKKISMPGKEVVRDALLRDGVIYVLASEQIRNASTHFDYCATPLSFDWDGTCFYIGTGASVDKAKTGMVLRVKSA